MKKYPSHISRKGENSKKYLVLIYSYITNLHVTSEKNRRTGAKIFEKVTNLRAITLLQWPPQCEGSQSTHYAPCFILKYRMSKVHSRRNRDIYHLFNYHSSLKLNLSTTARILIVLTLAKSLTVSVLPVPAGPAGDPPRWRWRAPVRVR